MVFEFYQRDGRGRGARERDDAAHAGGDARASRCDRGRRNHRSSSARVEDRSRRCRWDGCGRVDARRARARALCARGVRLVAKARLGHRGRRRGREWVGRGRHRSPRTRGRSRDGDERWDEGLDRRGISHDARRRRDDDGFGGDASHRVGAASLEVDRFRTLVIEALPGQGDARIAHGAVFEGEKSRQLSKDYRRSSGTGRRRKLRIELRDRPRGANRRFFTTREAFFCIQGVVLLL